MKKYLILNICLLPLLVWSQVDSTMYENGNLKSKSFYDENGILEFQQNYFETGELQVQAWYENSGALKNFYFFNEKGDTIKKSHIPKLKLEPKKNLNSIDWIELTDGLAYSKKELGKGDLLKKDDKVVIEYIGYFEDGSQFDNSKITGNPLKLVIGDSLFLKSFQSGLKKFKPGGKGYIKISPELGYGDIPYGNIPPNSTLIYFIKIKE